MMLDLTFESGSAYRT